MGQTWFMGHSLTHHRSYRMRKTINTHKLHMPQLFLSHKRSKKEKKQSITQTNFRQVPIIERFLATLTLFQTLKQLREHCFAAVWVGRWISAMFHGSAPINVHLPSRPRQTARHRCIRDKSEI